MGDKNLVILHEGMSFHRKGREKYYCVSYKKGTRGSRKYNKSLNPSVFNGEFRYGVQCEHRKQRIESVRKAEETKKSNHFKVKWTSRWTNGKNV